MKKRLLMPLNLQYFATAASSVGEGNQMTTPADNNNDQASPDGNSTEDGQEKGKTFTRDEVAKMIATETKKALSSAEEKWRAEKDEAAKLAEMDEKEKTDYEKQKLQAEIDTLKKEKT